jgi:TPR repeat protein
VNAQNNDGGDMHNGVGVSSDWTGAAHHFKLADAEGLPNARFNYVFGLQNGHCVPIDLEGVQGYFKLPARQGSARA